MRHVHRWLYAGLLLPLSQIVFPGCATMISGVSQAGAVRSVPKKARVYLDGKLIGETPQNFTVSRWGAHTLRLELEGYETTDVPLRKCYNPWASGNLFIGYAPIVIDALTGAIFDLAPPAAYYDAQRDPREWASGEISVLVTLKPAHGAQQIGKLQRKSIQ